MARPTAMTLKELKRQVDAAIKAGFGDRTILLSDDDEGNGFHYVWYDLCLDDDNINACLESAYSAEIPIEKGKYVMLG